MATGLSDIRKALRKAGMTARNTKRYARFIDADKPLDEQIISLAEDAPDLFRVDDDGYVYSDPADEDEDEDERPMTAAEAKRARLNGVHRLTPSRSEGSTPAERNAAALGAHRTRPERPTHAPATAQAAAARLRAGIGNGADA